MMFHTSIDSILIGCGFVFWSKHFRDDILRHLFFVTYSGRLFFSRSSQVLFYEKFLKVPTASR